MSDFDIRKTPARDYGAEIDALHERQKIEASRAHDFKMALIGAVLIFGGIVGVHYNYQYSGWAIFVGALLVL